ncbi:MAG: hypothetical protein WCH62_08780, partial [Candidatus Omnitrophota bacterium]
QQYLKAFKKGVYNYIKEDVDPQTQGIIPRKYFSGGLTMNGAAMDAAMSIIHHAPAIFDSDHALLVQAGINPFKGDVFPAEGDKTISDRAMVGEWQEGQENGLVYRFGWEKKLTPIEAQQQLKRMSELPENKPVDQRIFSSTELFDVSFILSTGGLDVSKNGEAIYDFYVRPGKRSAVDISPFYKGNVKLKFRAGKLDHWEGLDISPKRKEDFPWLEQHLQEKLNELKGESFTDRAQISTLAEGLKELGFKSQEIIQIKNSVDAQDQKYLLKLIKEGLLDWGNEQGLNSYQRQLINIMISSGNIKERVPLLLNEGELETLRGLVSNLNGSRKVKVEKYDYYGDAYSGNKKVFVFSSEFRKKLFEDVVQSKEIRQRAVRAINAINGLSKIKIGTTLKERIIEGLVLGKLDNGERIARAVKIIESLAKVKIKSNKIRERIIEALAWSDLNVDVDGILAKIVSWGQKLSDTPGWDNVTRSIAAALEAGDFNRAIDPQVMIKLVTNKSLGIRQGANVMALAKQEGIEDTNNLKRVLKGMLDKGVTKDNVIGILEWVNTSGIHEPGSKMVLKKILADRLEDGDAKQVLDWVEAKDANEKIMGSIIRILVKNDYLDAEGMRMFLYLLTKKNASNDAEIFLDQIEQVQGAFSRLKFNAKTISKIRAEAI